MNVNEYHEIVEFYANFDFLYIYKRGKLTDYREIIFISDTQPKIEF